MIDIYKALALLSDHEVETCLNGVLKGFVSTRPLYEELLASTSEMEKAIKEAAALLKLETGEVREVLPEERPKRIREILVTIAEAPDLQDRLEAWLRSARPTRLEPITGALVLAGVIFLLSTHVAFEYETVNNTRRLKIKVVKKPIAPEILKKFFSFFK